MKRKDNIIRYFLLLTGLLMLLAYTLPHHHHADGMPCYKVLAEANPADAHDTESHCCGCTGHFLFFDTSQSAASADGHLHLFPLTLLTDGFRLLAVPDVKPASKRQPAVYIESLHDTWLSAASGLRAPPSFVCR